MNGIIVVDKPQGMTSHDVVSFLRRKTGVKRIGHSGTLDPMATGVLPVFIGKATRIIEYASKPDDMEAKLYRCTMKLGISTDTQDIWGTVTAESELLPDAHIIEKVLKSFEGSGKQKPPMYSAVKIDGRKLYEYARKNEEVTISEREIYIKHIEVNEIDLVSREARFDVLCSKGVYIRAICADAGRILGCGAVMSGLVRLKSDGFSIDNAVSIDALNEHALPRLLPVDEPLSWLPKVEVDETEAAGFAHGKTIKTTEKNAPTGIVRVYSKDTFLGIGTQTDLGIKPKKVLV